MKQQWARLESRLKTHKPSLLADLHPPASDTDIQDLERALGVALPKAFIECLQVHNGQRGQADWLFSGSEFLSSRRILDAWAIWKDLLDGGDFDGADAQGEAGIRSVWWSLKWIPFAYNGLGDYLCLDLDPDSRGKVGQIISVWHDDGGREKVSDSFSLWFTAFVDNSV